MQNYRKTISHLIFQARKDSKLSRRAAEIRTGVPRSTLRDWENGTTAIPAEDFARLFAAYNKPMLNYICEAKEKPLDDKIRASVASLNLKAKEALLDILEQQNADEILTNLDALINAISRKDKK